MSDRFRVAMRNLGLNYDGELEANGRLRRFKAEGDHGKNSWFVLFPGPPAAGAFGCWKRGLKQSWCEWEARSMSQLEWKQVREKWQRADIERERAEAELQAEAQAEAVRIMKQGRDVESHPYLVRKGVHPHGELRQRRDELVVPLRDARGVLHSLQRIAPEKRFGDENDKRDKTFLFGGKISGSFFSIPGPDGPLVICEGIATGLSIHEATGAEVLCAMNCGNLLAVANAARGKWPDREIVIAGDNDQWKKDNPGATKATEAAKAIRAKLILPTFKDPTSRPTDFNDLYQLEGLKMVTEQIAGATQPKETDDEILSRLGELPALEYERCRELEAQRMGIKRVAILDDLVKAKRRSSISDRDNSAKPLVIELPEPWDNEVIGVDLFDELRKTLNRFIVLPDHADIAMVLWLVHSYMLDAFRITPYLNITSATKRCGKTTCLSVLGALACKSLCASSVSPAAVYRCIEQVQPSLIIDEADSFVGGNDELRGVLNSGNTRNTAFVVRCEGDPPQAMRFSTWCPKVLAGIGSLPGTLADRSIIINLKRKVKGEVVERFDDDAIDSLTLVRKLVRFSRDNSGAIGTIRPTLPPTLNDRAQDIWAPLLSIADRAGGDWPKLAQEAATHLSGAADDGALDDWGVVLMRDMVELMAKESVAFITPANAVKGLLELDERPWGAWGKSEKPITSRAVAYLLKPFGIESCEPDRRGGQKPGRYYDLDHFSETLSRYPLPSVTALQPNKDGDVVQFASVTAIAPVTGGKLTTPTPALVCNTATDEHPQYPVGQGDLI